MKTTTRKYKFNIPKIVVVEDMANQISRKKIFKHIFFFNLALTKPRVPNSTLHCMK